jgi:hypothetical protein
LGVEGRCVHLAVAGYVKASCIAFTAEHHTAVTGSLDVHFVSQHIRYYQAALTADPDGHHLYGRGLQLQAACAVDADPVEQRRCPCQFTLYRADEFQTAQAAAMQRHLQCMLLCGNGDHLPAQNEFASSQGSLATAKSEPTGCRIPEHQLNLALQTNRGALL